MNSPTIDDIRAAAERISPHVHRTPVLTCSTLDELAGRRLFFKCESLQKVGAFKFRGACNAVLRLTDEDAARGVMTHSSGNHAQALALAARIRGIPAHIVMPCNAPPVKKRAVLGYGAQVYDCEPNERARHEVGARIARDTGAVFIPPFDHPDVIAGQGTTAIELLEQTPDLDAIVAPVGGGGLMSGICIASRALRPGLRLIGAEPAGADDAARSLAAGHLVPQTGPDTVCDGLLTSLGQHTWAVLSEHLERIVTVTDDEVVAAVRLVWERMKLVVETNGAVPLAAVLTDEFRALEGAERIGIVLSGGNVDFERLGLDFRVSSFKL